MLAQSLNHMAAELDQRLETIVRQENEHQAVLSSMVEGVLAVDPEGAILSLNETCAEMLGVDAEQARGRLVHEAIRHASLLTFVEKALASPEPVEQDLEATRAGQALAARPRDRAARRPAAQDRRLDRAA